MDFLAKTTIPHMSIMEHDSTRDKMFSPMGENEGRRMYVPGSIDECYEVVCVHRCAVVDG
jgi:hypothetical protein